MTRALNQRGRAALDLALLGLALLALASATVGPGGAPRLLIVLAAACLLPGGALLTLLPVEDPLLGPALAVGLSLTVEALGTLAMAWSGFWHPAGWAVALGALACGLLLRDLARTTDRRTGGP
ncbi:MAG TPA: hypothetical protein VN618_14360 [Solirubrobacteraceae bacterium]|nr:hypothetical protein [Solirubrobacteraceae bacterium]